MPKPIIFTIPIRVVSEANQREHWAAKNRRKKAQQEATHLCLWSALKGKAFSVPATIKLVRLGAKMLDDDNLANGFKGVRDSIAKYAGIDDGDPRIKYEYAQEPNGKREYSVRVEIR